MPLAFQKSLENLGLGYIDLFLMHSPEAYHRIAKPDLPHAAQSIDDIELFPKDVNGQTLLSNVDYVDTWRAMEQLMHTNLVRSIGVSNFDIAQVQRLDSVAHIRPVVNQVECHPNKNQRPLIDYCASQGIAVTAYSPLGRPHEANGKQIAIFDPNVQLIASRYNKTPAQVILRYTVSALRSDQIRSTRINSNTFVYFNLPALSILSIFSIHFLFCICCVCVPVSLRGCICIVCMIRFKTERW